MRRSWPASSSTPATRCRSSTRWCGEVKADGAPVTGPPRRSGTPGPPTTRRPPRWSAPGWKGWCRPGPGRAAPTSSPRRSSPGPSSSWPPTPALRPGAAGRADRGGLRRARAPPRRSSERWPAAGSATPKAADLPAREMRKEETRPCPLPPSPGHAAAEPGDRPDAGQDHRSRRRAGRPLRATASCRPARARRGVPARPRRAHRPRRHRLAARPGQPGPRGHARPASRLPVSAGQPPGGAARAAGPAGRRAHQRPGRPSRSPAPDPPSAQPATDRTTRSDPCSPTPRRRR